MVIVMTAVAHEVRGDGGQRLLGCIGLLDYWLLQLNSSAGGDPLEGQTASFLGDDGLFTKAENFYPQQSNRLKG